MPTIEKLDMHSSDKVAENITKIGNLFPNCITETLDENGKPVKAIDFDILKQELSKVVVDGPKERYQFTWPDKKKSMLLANSPISATLRPCRAESVNFDTTENLYIEGDNLDVLKLLQETYLGKVKMIYIDPPYNTGNDFVYEDKWEVDSEQWVEMSGDYDDQGNRLRKNNDTNGRFHTDWLNMVYPRLKLARDLLKDDGVIFISIDDNEVENLKKICNEIFGQENFIATVVWKHTQQSKNDERFFSRQFNLNLVYSKNKVCLPNFHFERTEEDNKNYSNPDDDPKGYWRSGDVRSPNYRRTLCYDILAPNGNTIKAPDNGWRWSKESIMQKIESGEVIFKKDFSGIIRKIYLSEQLGRTPENLWDGDKFGTTRQATALIKDLFNGTQVFDTPKPKELIEAMLKIASTHNDIILDFFSGSATTAHAVMQLNAEDGGKRKFIMVQIPEATDETSEAFKTGYKNICEIGKERIRRAGKKVVSDKWEVISKEEKIQYGCREIDSRELSTNNSALATKTNGVSANGYKELSRADCMAKGDGPYRNDLFSGQEVAEGGDIRVIGSNETGGSVNSVKHSRGTVAEFNQGIYSISGDSKRFQGGTGDTASSLRESAIPCRYGHFGSDGVITGDRKNAECAYKNTIHCPLTTKHLPDIGFRVLKLDSSNMKDVYYSPEAYVNDPTLFDQVHDNIKEDRSGEDLLFQVMLDLGIELSADIKAETIAGKNIYSVKDNYLLACFDTDVTDELLTEIAKRKPFYAVLRDSSFTRDDTASNFEQIFATWSPETIKKVL